MLLRRGKHLLLDRISRLRAGLGGTPLLSLPNDELDLVTKLEFCNPTGSTKDRSALRILEQAIRRGEITPETTVIESSSGNFAISLATYCRLLGITFVPVIDQNCNAPTEGYLRTLCDTVEKVDKRDATGGYLNTRLARVHELVAGRDDAYWPNQYANLDALDAHYRFTGGELINTINKIDYLFVGVGTAGTLAGLSQRIKEEFPRCTVVAVDTAGSAIFGGERKPRHIPGIGSSIVPPLTGHAVIDDVLIVPEPWAARGCRELFERHGLYAGGSTGSVYAAIRAYFAGRPPVVFRPTVVFLSADRGHAYANTVYDPAWVQRLPDHGEPITTLPVAKPALQVGGEELAWTS